jgi:hypothetical protein
MQSQSQQATASTAEEGDADDHDPFFVVSVYPNGLMTVAVEGSGDDVVDGETLLSFHPWSGVEIGHSSIIAEAGNPSMLLFQGSYDEQRDIFFSTWDQLARENERPAIFLEGSLEALLKLGRVIAPPLPATDIEEPSASTTCFVIP